MATLLYFQIKTQTVTQTAASGNPRRRPEFQVAEGAVGYTPDPKVPIGNHIIPVIQKIERLGIACMCRRSVRAKLRLSRMLTLKKSNPVPRFRPM